MANILQRPAHLYFDSTDCQLLASKWIERKRRREKESANDNGEIGVGWAERRKWDGRGGGEKKPVSGSFSGYTGKASDAGLREKAGNTSSRCRKWHPTADRLQSITCFSRQCVVTTVKWLWWEVSAYHFLGRSDSKCKGCFFGEWRAEIKQSSRKGHLMGSLPTFCIHCFH